MFGNDLAAVFNQNPQWHASVDTSPVVNGTFQGVGIGLRPQSSTVPTDARAMATILSSAHIAVQFGEDGTMPSTIDYRVVIGHKSR
jgi:hypothetical protein